MSELASKSKFKRAVALEYSGLRDQAPLVSAKGEEIAADELVKLARRFGVPVIERAELSRALSLLEDGQEIPEELYQAVALLLNEIES